MPPGKKMPLDPVSVLFERFNAFGDLFVAQGKYTCGQYCCVPGAGFTYCQCANRQAGGHLYDGIKRVNTAGEPAIQGNAQYGE